MWGEYDENLTENRFFQTLTTDHTDLIKRASQESWVVCVPRQDSLHGADVATSAILDHILVASGAATGPNHYTLSKRPLTVSNRQIATECGDCVAVHFEETFYIDNTTKYTVWCIEQPLFTKPTMCDHRPSQLTNLHDCIDFLWAENVGFAALERIQKLCDNCTEFDTENMQNQKELIGNLYSQCLQAVISAKIDEKIKNESYFAGLKVAVEAYMQHCLGWKLMRAVNTLTWRNDAVFNKTTRNAAELQLNDLNISNKFGDAIANAKCELQKINNHATIVDKMNCLQKTFAEMYNCNSKIITSDDVLQIFVYLIVKLNVSNWLANLIYLTQFNFSTCNTSNYCDRNQFLMTSFEAAVEFVKSSQFVGMCRILLKSTQFHYAFELVRIGDLKTLRKLTKVKADANMELCHPLCNCEQCRIAQTHSSGLNVINDTGQTLLIYASFVGRCDVVDFLVSVRADVNASDCYGRTPLHYACLRGHQNILLVLLNSKGDPNVKDNDGNSCLHAASNNGHESCVKALIYTGKISDVNCYNNRCETPLHLASKWSYFEIGKILMENGANPNLPNKRGKTSFGQANNYYMCTLLEKFAMKTAESPAVERNSKEIVPGGRRTRSGVHGTRPRDGDQDQVKRFDLLMKAIQNNDLPLTCFYLGFSTGVAVVVPQSMCHPLCNCDKCCADQVVAAAAAAPPPPPPATPRPAGLINVNLCDADGFTPLHLAAKCGRTEILRILLDSGALPNLKTYKTFYSPLHLACIYQTTQIVKELVKCGECHVDALDFRGNTPLYYACVKNNVRTVEILLTNGADCTIKNFDGNTTIGIVQEKKLYKIFKLLRNQDRGDADDLF